MGKAYNKEQLSNVAFQAWKLRLQEISADSKDTSKFILSKHDTPDQGRLPLVSSIKQGGLYERGRDAVLKHRNREGPGARTPSRKREKQSYGCERDDSPETEQRKSFKLCQTHFRFMAGISYTSYNGNIQRGKRSFIVCILRWKH